MAKRVAVVTGAHEGLGLEIVRGLCKELDGDVILTASDEGQGQTAVESLEKEGWHAVSHQLDVADHESILRLRDFIKDNYGGLDILVNNASVAFFESSLPFAEQAVEAVKINYFGVLETSAILFPLLRPHARVCNVSSMIASSTLKQCSPDLNAKLTNSDVTIQELSVHMTHFVQLAHENTHLEEGYPDDAYGFSKIGLTVMSVLQQKELDRQGADDIIVNSCCPGTDMKLNGALSEAEGVVTPLYCCLLPPNINSPRGEMIRFKEPVDWMNSDLVLGTM